MSSAEFDVLQRIRRGLMTLLRSLISLQYYGKKRYCPVCGRYSRKFLDSGVIPRQDAMCPYCRSLERHRFAWIFLKSATPFFSGQKIRFLHIAPETCFKRRFRNLHGENYITADLLDKNAMVVMDITDIKYEDRFFDAIYCSHVLEHVKDDKKGIREFHRILKNDGWAALAVPVSGDKTHEDPLLVTPAERLRAFGQKDHLRVYGRDFPDRLSEAGFTVKTVGVFDLVDNDTAIKMGLTPASGDIYFCTK